MPLPDEAPLVRTMAVDGAPGAHQATPQLQGGAGKTAWSVELVPLPGGTFTAGALPGEPGAEWWPPREVTVAPFLLADVETPWGLFVQYCDPANAAAWPTAESPCLVHSAGDDYPPAEHEESKPNLPAENLSWWDAAGFANWLTTKELGAAEQVYTFAGAGDTRTVTIALERKGYRLPTPEEWEWAARAGKTSAYGEYGNASWGCDFTNTPIDDCYPGAPDVFDDKLAPARPPASGKGDFKPNSWGLYHLNGNVQEWVSASVTSPKGRELMVYSGGSYSTCVMTRAGDPRPAYDLCMPVGRSEDLPTRERNDLGFRLARTP